MKTIRPIQTLNYPLIWLSSSLILGIVVGYYFHIPLIYSGVFVGLIVFTLISIHLSGYASTLRKRFFHLTTGLCFFGLGIFQYEIMQPTQDSNHFIHFHQDNPSVLIGVVKNQLKPNPFQFQYIVSLQSQNNEARTGDLLLKIPKTDVKPTFKNGDIIAFAGPLEPIPTAKNPFQFDYSSYQKTKGVWGQTTTKLENIIQLGTEKGVNYLLGTIRDRIQKGFDEANFSETNKGILIALLIGNRQLIDKKTSDNYANAGAIHVLAISGLHIGILLYFFSFLLKPIGSTRKANLIRLTLQIGFLWSFALLAGMSASVVRAVTMFSFLSIGYQLFRGTFVYHTLAASALVLLLIKPTFLFDVGFQMSYTAVLGIVSIQPYFKRKWQANQKVVQYFYEIITVSLSAQIALIPLCLYYFHQFPGLFLITNLLVIPLITLALICGLLCIFILTFSSIPNFLALTMDGFLTFLNRFIEWIAHKDEFLFKEIPFHLSWVFILNFFLISFVLFFIYQKKKMIFGILSAVVLFQISWLYLYHWKPKSELLVLHRYKENLLLMNLNGNITSFQSNYSVQNQKLLRSYETGSFSKIKNNLPLPSVLAFNEYKILIVDSLGVIPEGDFTHWIMTHSPKINLERLIQKNPPQCIVVDGSNRSYLINEWKKTCEQNKILFHNTFEKGYFKIE